LPPTVRQRAAADVRVVLNAVATDEDAGKLREHLGHLRNNLQTILHHHVI
jgi:hypothetical protein